MYVFKGCLNKYISAATWPLQIKIPGSAPGHEGGIFLGSLELNLAVIL